MYFKTHLAFSFFILLLIIYFFEHLFLDFSNLEKLLFALIFMFASLFADLDNTKSKYGKNIFPISWIFKHRGFFHSIFSVIFFSLIIAIINIYYAISFFLGYLSHIILDMFNYKGIILFYPFSKYKIKGIIKSNGLFDKTLFLIFFSSIFIMIYLINSK
ncbi:MAG: metal-dependent hydrolase [Candidatus Woesearchaeota archaeon]